VKCRPVTPDQRPEASLARSPGNWALRGVRQRVRKSGRAKPARAAAPVKSEAGTKADAIRQTAQGLPKPIRPRDVIAKLSEQGIAVSNAQVGQVLKGMGMRRRRGRRAMKVEVVASTLTLDSLLAAKKLVNQLGSVEVAKQVVDALARIS
jgi:hypothetical protein